MSSWGYHLIIDARKCSLEVATNPKLIKKFIKKLVDTIEMVPYGKPKVVHFAKDTCNAGWTVIQLIETSSIVGHFLDINGDLYLDVFSCKKFDKNTVIDFLKKELKPKKVKCEFVKRKA